MDNLETFENFYLKPCSTILLVGSSGAGKTTIAKELIANHEESFPSAKGLSVHKVVICYNVWQPLYDEIIEQFPSKKVFLYNGFPAEKLSNPEFWRHPTDSKAISYCFIDDLQNIITTRENLPALERLFCALSHHERITVILSLHNLFTPGLQTTKLNSNYIFYLKSSMPGLTLTSLQRYCFPQSRGILWNATNLAFNPPFNSRYLLIDSTLENANSNYRLRCGVLPSERARVGIMFAPQ